MVTCFWYKTNDIISDDGNDLEFAISFKLGICWVHGTGDNTIRYLNDLLLYFGHRRLYDIFTIPHFLDLSRSQNRNNFTPSNLHGAQVFEPNSAWTVQLQSQFLGNFRQTLETFRALPESPEKYIDLYMWNLSEN